MKLLLRKLEFGWHVLAFILLSGAFVPLWRQNVSGSLDPALGDPVQRAFLGITYLGVILLMFHLRRALIIMGQERLLWMLVGWALISLFWSAAPDLTLRRSFSLILATLYSLLLVVRYSFSTVLRILSTALAIIVVASLCIIWLFPQWGVMGVPHPGAWQGVFYHKNAFGRACALALLVFWTLYRSKKGFLRYVWLALLLSALVALIGSRSVTSWAVTLALAVSWLSLRGLTKVPRLLRPAIVALTTAVTFPTLLIVPNYLEDILGFLGKDSTLTGRIPLWKFLVPLGLERPFLGYGYGAFWQGANGPSATVWILFRWAQHAHNGYIDLWLELGLVGVLLALILFIRVFVRTGQRALQNSSVKIWEFAFLFTLFFMLISFTEAVLLESGLSKALYWVLFSYVAFLSSTLNSR